MRSIFRFQIIRRTLDSKKKFDPEKVKTSILCIRNIHTYTCILCAYMCTRARVCVCVHTHTHICIHAYICTERACTDTHTHTHTQRQTHPYQYLSFRRLVHRKKIIYGWFFASTNSKQRANIDASWQSRGRNNVIIDNCEHLHEFRIKNTCKTFFYLICKTFLLIT